MEAILAWADAHHRATGDWPKQKSGRVTAAPDETWAGIDVALRDGLRGFSGGSSLARLLHEKRGARNGADLPHYTEQQVLAWADGHHARTGDWPAGRSGPILDAAGETWNAVDQALSQGLRGFPGGSSLARLLARRRGVRNPVGLPR